MGFGTKRADSKGAGRRLNEAVRAKRSSGHEMTHTKPTKPSPPKHHPMPTVGHSKASFFPEQRMGGKAEISAASCANAASDLERYCKLNSLPAPKFTVLAQRDSFLCTVVFNDSKYHSYPDLSATELQARDRAAFKVLEKLRNNTIQVKQPPIDKQPKRPRSKMDTTEQIECVVDKLLKMLERKPLGIFCHAIPELYAADFNVDLPEYWLEKIRGNPRLEIINNNGNVEVLCKKNGAPSSTPKSQKIQELAFPSGGAEIFVTNVINANHFLASVDRDRRRKMESELNAFYSQENVAKRLKLQPSEEPAIGTFYATLIVGWCRVECVGKQSGSEAAEYRLVDCGATQTIPKDKIYHLANTFYSFPLFLTSFRLQDIAHIDESEAEDPETVAEVQRLILLKRVWVVPAPGCNPTARPLPVRVLSKPDCGSGSEVETTDNQLSSHVEVNPRVYRLLATPTISSATGCSEAYLSSVSPDGTFSLQIESFGLQELRRLTIEPSVKVCVEKVLFDEAYCALLGGRWSRCVATRIASDKEIGIEFIDYGVEDTVSIEEIFPLKLSGPIKDLPPQAVRTHLAGVIPYKRWSKSDISEITQTCPPDQKLIVELSKVVGCRRRFCDLTIRHVNIFKPTESSDQLVSLNLEVYRKLRKLA